MNEGEGKFRDGDRVKVTRDLLGTGHGGAHGTILFETGHGTYIVCLDAGEGSIMFTPTELAAAE